MNAKLQTPKPLTLSRKAASPARLTAITPQVGDVVYCDHFSDHAPRLAKGWGGFAFAVGGCLCNVTLRPATECGRMRRGGELVHPVDVEFESGEVAFGELAD